MGNTESNRERRQLRLPQVFSARPSSFIISLVQGFSFLLVLFFVLRSFRVHYFMTIRRITYPLEFTSTIFGSEIADVIGIIMLVPLSFIFYFRFGAGRTLQGVLTALFLIEALASSQLALLPSNISNPFLRVFLDARNQFFYTFGTLSVWLIVLLIAASCYRLLVSSPHRDREAKSTVPRTRTTENSLLVFSIAISMLAAFYPYSPGINPNQMTVSVDTPHYVRFVNEMNANPRGILSAFSEVSNGDRPIPIIMIHMLKLLSGIDIVPLINHLPLLFGPALVISTYFLARSNFSDKRISSIAAILTGSSHYIVVGIYGGFFANWLALILMMLAFTFAIKASNGFDAKNLGATSLILVLILFTHPYTWSPLLLSIFLFFFVMSTGKIAQKARVLLKSVVIVAIPNIVAENLKVMLLNSVGGLSGDYAVASTSVSLEQFFLRFSNLNYTLSTYVGGYLSNPFVILLSIICLLIAPNTRFTKMAAALIVAISFPLFFGDYLIQSRLIYLLPFPLLAALALAQLDRVPRLTGIIIPLVLLMSINYAFWALANLPL